MQYRAVILDLMRRFANVVDVKDIGLGICKRNNISTRNSSSAFLCVHIDELTLNITFLAQGRIIDFMLLFLQLLVFRRQDAEKVTIVSIGDVHKQQPEAPDEEYEEYISHLFGYKCPGNPNEVQDLRHLSFQNDAVCIGVNSRMSRDVGYIVPSLALPFVLRSTVHKVSTFQLDNLSAYFTTSVTLGNKLVLIGSPLDNTYLGVTKRMPLLRRSLWYGERLKALPKGGAPQYEDLCKKFATAIGAKTLERHDYNRDKERHHRQITVCFT
ncbi:hypothetical protein Tco_0245860 [Tanacetum coccineum]